MNPLPRLCQRELTEGVFGALVKLADILGMETVPFTNSLDYIGLRAECRLFDRQAWLIVFTDVDRTRYFLQVLL